MRYKHYTNMLFNLLQYPLHIIYDLFNKHNFQIRILYNIIEVSILFQSKYLNNLTNIQFYYLNNSLVFNYFCINIQ